ncbi:MAG: hypothetical protein MUF81_16780 [Verrucomicrobia bacterium]|jgi:hypothetical protein|nr:hypothetical protein [Verrucomicrobiota bacterium]
MHTESPVKHHLALAVILASASVTTTLCAAEDVRPDEIQFRRQAVVRMVFDSDQNIPLASLRPAKVFDLDLMHPEMRTNSGVKWDLKKGSLQASAAAADGSSLRWVGGFNPFATYDLVIADATGGGSAGITFSNKATGDSLSAALLFSDGQPAAVHWTVITGGKPVTTEKWPVPAGTVLKDLTLRAQMSAVGVNLFLESAGRSDLIGCTDFAKHFDLRERKRIQSMDFLVGVDLKAGAHVTLAGATSSLTPGSGQADIRAITDEEGAPLLDDGRLWFTMTVRGRALPHPLQGVFSLNPSVFDLRFEGIIVFDMDDGLLRNDLASHLFRDSKSGEWRGWTTGFSALGDTGKGEEKMILAIHSVRNPRRGFSVMKARPIGLTGAHEDPHGIYDKDAGKWRLLLCEHGKKFRAGMWQSDQWDRGYTRLAGPVEMDSTGTMIQKFGNKRYALFGSADRKIYIRTYPDLEPAGELKVDLPPWNDQNGTRIWPNVIPLPEGYPAPYIALMMDRVNFPGMPKPNWTYGALYLYHGFPTKP